jgi:hypothetical protein
MATSAGATRPADQITFAHNSERQFARLLDFYRVEWEYEPTAFPIEWDAAGNAVQHFRPDFYLPGFGLYIEITTLNQRLVTKKNRKVRRLRELYPDVRIKVLYQRDYLSLLAKYGLEPPSQMVEAEVGATGSPAEAGTAEEIVGPEVRASRPRIEAGTAGESAAPQPGATRPPPEPVAPGSMAPAVAGPGEAGPPSGEGRSAHPESQPAATARRARAGNGAAGEGPPAAERTGGTAGRARVERRPSARTGGAGERAPAGRSPDGMGRAVERARAAGRPRVLPDPSLNPSRPAPPLPADPELVRLAQVLLPAEIANRRGPAAAKRAG